MIQIDGLAEVVLNVRDASRAVAFYRDVLGLQRISAEGQPGPIFFRAGQANDQVPSLLVLVPLPAGAPAFAAPRTLHHLALTVPAAAFDDARSALVEAGIEVRDGQHPVLAVRTMYITDPDGNEVELISPHSVI
jgi:catechol 2,3-dioxygenase-like lactoylglutathione lyase family enzyme